MTLMRILGSVAALLTFLAPAAADNPRAPYSVSLDPTLLWENGGLFTVGTSPNTAAAAIPSSAQSGAPFAYWRVGNSARWKWSGVSGEYMEVDFVTTSGNGTANTNDMAGVLVNDGVNLWPMYTTNAPSGNGTSAPPGMHTIRVWLPPGAAKTVELFVPMQNAINFSPGIPFGSYPVAARFSSPVTAVTPPSPAKRLCAIGDSITSGGVSIAQTINGWGGLMKRGLSAQFGSNWLSAYNSGTTYAVGNTVSFNNWIWRALTINTAVTPVAGANWSLVGYNGTVTLLSYGTRYVASDATTSGTANAFAAAIAALSPSCTQILIADGSNDQGAVPPTSLANFTTFYTNLLNGLFASMPSVPIVVLSPILRNNPEIANSNGNTMTQFRTVEHNACTAYAGTCQYIEGSTFVPYSALGVDVIHPNTQGNILFMNNLQLTGFFN